MYTKQQILLKSLPFPNRAGKPGHIFYTTLRHLTTLKHHYLIMPHTDPVTVQWIVAIVKEHFTSIREEQHQKDTITAEIASLKGRIFEAKSQLDDENTYNNAQEQLIATQRDLINSLRGDLADYEEADVKQAAGVTLRISRASSAGLSKVVLPASLPLPASCPQDILQEMVAEPAKEFLNGNQLDSEQSGHDYDSCYLCREEAKQDSEV